jgi:hypothetical protein
MVDAAGIEPATPSMSTRCSPTELRVRAHKNGKGGYIGGREGRQANEARFRGWAIGGKATPVGCPIPTTARRRSRPGRLARKEIGLAADRTGLFTEGDLQFQPADADAAADGIRRLGGPAAALRFDPAELAAIDSLMGFGSGHAAPRLRRRGMHRFRCRQRWRRQILPIDLLTEADFNAFANVNFKCDQAAAVLLLGSRPTSDGAASRVPGYFG